MRLPAGGVLTQFLRSMVVDNLLAGVNCHGIYTQGYADNVCIIGDGSFLDTVTEIVTSVLSVKVVY